MTTYLAADAFAFLKALKRNNNRDWFLKNKSRYDDGIKAPLQGMVAAIEGRIRKASPHFKGHIFRIYRDVRFSADKSPYKTHVGVYFGHRFGSEKVHSPGFYLHLEPGECFFAAGMWHPDSASLRRIRNAILDDPDQWRRLLKKTKLKLEGDSLKRPPPGYDRNHAFIKDIMRKDYIASVAIADRDFTGAQLFRKIEAGLRHLGPLVEYLSQHVGLPY